MKITPFLQKGLLILASLFLALPLVSAQTTTQPYDLRCEYLTNPLAIDVQLPRFSWKQGDPAQARGQKQTAYHVLVASSTDILAQDRGDLWDSLKVMSNQSALVPYAGTTLTSNQDCYWKVQQYDKDGNPSAAGALIPHLSDESHSRRAI